MAWAAQLERDRRFEDCDDCYKMGIARKAEPLQKLQEDYERFQMRMVERVRRDLDDKDAAAGPSSSSAAVFGGRGGPSSSSTSFANASTSSSSGKRTAFNVLTSADAGGMARPTWDQRGILGSQPGAVGNAGWGKMGSSSSSGRENWDPFDDGGPGGGAGRKNLFDSVLTAAPTARRARASRDALACFVYDLFVFLFFSAFLCSVSELLHPTPRKLCFGLSMIFVLDLLILIFNHCIADWSMTGIRLEGASISRLRLGIACGFPRGKRA